MFYFDVDPGTISKLSANWDWVNFSMTIIWDKPNDPAVIVDYYEVQVGTSKGREDYQIHNTTGM